MKKFYAFLPILVLFAATIACSFTNSINAKPTLAPAATVGPTYSLQPTFTALPTYTPVPTSPSKPIATFGSTVTVNQVATISPTTMVSVTPISKTEKWAGTWTNSLGESGEDTLEITDDGSGNIKGVWSGNIVVTGQWLDKTTLKLSGRTATRDYQIKGTLQGNTLLLSYVATRLNTSGTYTGEEKLTRVLP